MVVAKKQGRSEDQSEDFRKNKQHSFVDVTGDGSKELML